MNVLISGGHGLIGRALADDLAADGHRVVRLQRPGSAAPSAPPPPPVAGPAAGGPVRVDWDPAGGTVDRDTLQAAGPYGAVVNLAGAGIADRRWSPARKAEILDSRVRSTALLAAEVGRLDPGPAVMVSASAIGYYGDRGSEELTEASGPGQGFLADVCRAWEAAADPVAEHGVRLVSLRTSLVLAPGGGVLGKQLPFFKLGLGAKLGDGRQYQSWITVHDEVAVVRRAIEDADLVGPVNASTPQPVTNAEFTRALGRALHRPAALGVPRAALELALGHEMAAETVLVSQRVLPGRLTSIGFEFAQPGLDGALASLLGPRH